MANVNDIIEGLTILAKHDPHGLDANVAADHDIIFGPGKKDVPEDDRKRLEQLGWFWDKEYDCWAMYV